MLHRAFVGAAALLFLGGGGSTDGGVGGGGADGGIATGPTQLTSGEQAQALAIDGENVYWAERSPSTGSWRDWHHTIRAVSKAGGTPWTLSDGAGTDVQGLIAVDGWVYWSMLTCLDPCDNSFLQNWNVYRVRATGGDVQTYVVDATGQIAVDSARFYFRIVPKYGGGIASMRLDGTGGRQQLADTQQGTGPVLVGASLYFIAAGGNPDLGFWSALQTLPAAGGAVTTIRTETNSVISANGLVLNGGTAFTSTQAGLWRLPLDGSKWQVIWGGANIATPDANGGRAYFAQSPYNSYPGCLGRANRDGSDARCIDQGNHQYLGVKVDDTSAFFIRDGEIWRVPR